MASQAQNDPITNIRTGISGAQIALHRIDVLNTALSPGNPNDAAAIRDALTAISSATTDTETLLAAANAQMIAQATQLTAAAAALATCKTSLDAANSKLAQVPKTANGGLAKPGMYFSTPAVGAIAIGVGMLGLFGGYWFRGTATSKNLLSPGKAKESAAEEAGEEAAEKKKKKRAR